MPPPGSALVNPPRDPLDRPPVSDEVGDVALDALLAELEGDVSCMNLI